VKLAFEVPPTGDGATARFDEIGFVRARLADLRSGA
jgi:hypothetical protein